LDFADFIVADPGHPVIEKARSLQEKKAIREGPNKAANA